MIETSKLVVTYLLTVPVFFAIDMLWLGLIAKDFYAKQLGSLMTNDINWVAAVIFYLAYIFGIMFFAVVPGLDKDSLRTVLINGAVFGGLAYATYDLTNLATLKNWPTTLVFVDILWGIVLTTSVAVSSYYIALWVS